MENGGGSKERDPPLLFKRAKYQSGKVKADGCLTVHLHSLLWAPSVATDAQPIRVGISAITGGNLMIHHPKLG
jgi:hypothetical protein